MDAQSHLNDSNHRQEVQHRDTRHLDIQNFPFLTQEEFKGACHYLDQRYTQATLGILRTQFALSIHNMSFNADIIWVSIIKPIVISKIDDIDLSRALENLRWGGGGGDQIDTNMAGESEQLTLMDTSAEDDDINMVAAQHSLPMKNETTAESNSDNLPAYNSDAQQPYVVYEIHLHETYRMPSLWFSLHDLPPGNREFDLEAVYRYIVPDQHKAMLRASGFGPGGALSAAPHPVTGVPCFFVHPCQTTEAMSPWEAILTLENYLMIWLGMHGNVVGLNLPVQLAQV